VPLLTWLDEIPKPAKAKCIARIRHLGACGYELRRPEADFLRDGIHELRIVFTGIQYRILYFFHGGTAVVLSHAFVKMRARVPDQEIERAMARKRLFEKNPALHTYKGGI
jgi:phage-related protein